jgi:hemolysin D
MFVDGVDVLLSPGMTVTAEVTTGTRRLIDYVLSPVMEHVKESGRER